MHGQMIPDGDQRKEYKRAGTEEDKKLAQRSWHDKIWMLMNCNGNKHNLTMHYKRLCLTLHLASLQRGVIASTAEPWQQRSVIQ
jgi:hypothetical protein